MNLKNTLLKRKWLRFENFNFCILGFLIPFLGLGLTLLIRAIATEASSSTAVFSMLHSDAYHQYFPFFKMFRRSILSGDSLLFTWDIGLGMDYLGIISYYLGSPLNLFSIFVPESWLVDYFTLLNPIRVGLAGLFFSLMLQKVFDKNDISIALFGSFYGTCAWTLGYMWNSMWMDTFALLPLVVLGTVSLLKHRKFILYTVSLCLSVAINYYIGLFTCIFTLLVFICYQICRFRSFKRFCIDLGLMALFTVIALGMTAIITLPAYMQLQTTSSSVNKLPDEFQLNKYLPTAATITELQTGVREFLSGIMDPESEAYEGWYNFLSKAAQLFEGMKQVATNTFALTKANFSASEGLPNIYCGIFASFFVFLSLFCRSIKKRERICGILLLLFFNASFMIRQLDYIWHGFHFPNMIPYRFSFLYSFVMLFMAYRVWIARRRLRLWQVLTATGMTAVLIVASNAFGKFTGLLEETSLLELLTTFSSTDLTFAEIAFPIVNFGFLLLYSACLTLSSIRFSIRTKSKNCKLNKKQKRENALSWYRNLKFRRRLASLFFVIVISVEFLLNVAFFGTYCSVVNLSHYPRGREDAERIIQIMKQQDDDLFYRTEVTHTQTYNDGALNDYHGITTFSSSANASVTRFMQALGFEAMGNWNRYAYEETTPVANLFLNLKYMIERQDKLENNPYFTNSHKSGKVHLQENNYYLPLGFLVEPALAELDFENESGSLSFQNALLTAATGAPMEAMRHVSGSNVSISGSSNVTVSNINTSTDVSSCSYKANSSGGSVFYTYTFEEEGFFCLRFNLPKRNDITVSYDDGSGYKTLFTESYSIPTTHSVCQVKPGDRIQVTLKCKANESSTTKLTGGLFDEYVIRDAHHALSQSTLNVTTFESTLVEGTIDCHKDGLLYTSIPHCGNWDVYVDGEEAEVTLIGGAMTGVMLTEGSHTVTFRYHNDAFTLGCIISGISLLAFGAIIWYIYFFQKKQAGKYTPPEATE